MTEPVGRHCGACGRQIAAGFQVRGGDIRCWRHVVLHPAVWHRSLATALIVGSILTTINQGNLILQHGFTSEILIKMGLTYCVPFCVSTSGALGAARTDFVWPDSKPVTTAAVDAYQGELP
jgi:hypothetical protein